MPCNPLYSGKCYYSLLLLVKQIGITLLCVVVTIYYSHTTLKQLAFIYFMRLKKHLKTYDFHCQVSKKAYHRHLVCIQK